MAAQKVAALSSEGGGGQGMRGITKGSRHIHQTKYWAVQTCAWRGGAAKERTQLDPGKRQD
eukprot:1136587-Pelagomonas_calceolata.AAC.1